MQFPWKTVCVLSVFLSRVASEAAANNSALRTESSKEKETRTTVIAVNETVASSTVAVFDEVTETLPPLTTPPAFTFGTSRIGKARTVENTTVSTTTTVIATFPRTLKSIRSTTTLPEPATPRVETQSNATKSTTLRPSVKTSMSQAKDDSTSTTVDHNFLRPKQKYGERAFQSHSHHGPTHISEESEPGGDKPREIEPIYGEEEAQERATTRKRKKKQKRSVQPNDTTAGLKLPVTTTFPAGNATTPAGGKRRKRKRRNFDYYRRLRRREFKRRRRGNGAGHRNKEAQAAFDPNHVWEAHSGRHQAINAGGNVAGGGTGNAGSFHNLQSEQKAKSTAANGTSTVSANTTSTSRGSTSTSSSSTTTTTATPSTSTTNTQGATTTAEEETHHRQVYKHVHQRLPGELDILVCARTGDIDCVTKRLTMDITYWWTTDDGTPEGTLAHYAAVQGWVPILSTIASLVAEKHKNNALSPHYAALTTVPADVNPLTAKNTYDYRTPLLSACKGGHVDALEFILNKTSNSGGEKKRQSDGNEEKNAKPEDELEDKKNINEAGMTCAHIAARENRANVLTFLANREKRVGSKHGVFREDYEGWTPLHYAVHNGNKAAALTLLLDAKEDPYWKWENGESPMEMARKSKDQTMISLLEDPLGYRIGTIIQAEVQRHLSQSQTAFSQISRAIQELKETVLDHHKVYRALREQDPAQKSRKRNSNAPSHNSEADSSEPERTAPEQPQYHVRQHIPRYHQNYHGSGSVQRSSKRRSRSRRENTAESSFRNANDAPTLAVKRRELVAHAKHNRRLHRRSTRRDHVPDHDSLRASLLASFSKYCTH